MSQNSSSRRAPSLFWPIILIGIGLIWLLANLGILPADPWPLLWQFWPVILIVIGLDVLLGRRGVIGSVVGAVLALLVVAAVAALLFFAPSSPTWLGMPVLSGNAELHTEHIVHPLEQVRAAEVTIDFPGGQGSINALGDSANLLEGDVDYYGQLTNSLSKSGDYARIRLDSRFISFFQYGIHQQTWRIGLNPRVEYDLRLNSGSGVYDFDLSKFTVRSLRLDAGSGSVSLNLPASGQYRFQLDAGSGSVAIRVPAGVAVRVEYNAGSGSFDAPGLSKVSGGRRDGVYESAGFSQSGAYVIVELDGGSGSVTMR